jgi:[ribosomal protein S5]-alanine N-acetyltransferase
MKIPFLIGKHIYLRTLLLEDLSGNYLNWLNDSEVCKYNAHHYFPYAHANAEEFIKNAYQTKDKIILAVVLKQKEIHIGNISLQNINFINRIGEFAILMGEKLFWGKGYAKEASLLIVKHGFDELNLHRICCGTSSENVPMQKLAEYLGMKREGVRREALFKHGRFVDIFDYGVLKTEFYDKLILGKENNE